MNALGQSRQAGHRARRESASRGRRMVRVHTVRLERVVQGHRDRSEKGGLSFSCPNRDEQDAPLTPGCEDGVSEVLWV